MVKMVLVKSSTDWKDKRIGWGGYKVTFYCKKCGEYISEMMYGVPDNITKYYEKSLCDKCKELDVK